MDGLSDKPRKIVLKTLQIRSPHEAAEIIRGGGVVAFPTETVFGLGADATNPEAIRKLFAAKGRPSDNPLIVHVSERGKCGLAASIVTRHAEVLLQAFSPGPLTVVLPKQPTIDDSVTAGLQTVGIRIPRHEVAAEILRLADVPVAAPSANLSGRPSGTTWRSVWEDLVDRVDAVYCEDSTCFGIESTVVDCTRDVPLVLRPGAISLAQIRSVVPEAEALEMTHVASDSQESCDLRLEINSPGLLHPHYQPRAKVRLIECWSHGLASGAKTAYCGLESGPVEDSLGLYRRYDNVEAYAADFYEFLREVDRRSIDTVYVQLAPEEGIGTALRDRQRRSAAMQ